MSNYTAKRRAGGGNLIGTQANAMTTAGETGPELFEITYANTVDAATALTGTWKTTPTGRVSLDAINLNPTTLEVTFDGDISADTSVTYQGNATLFVSPQTILIT